MRKFRQDGIDRSLFCQQITVRKGHSRTGEKRLFDQKRKEPLSINTNVLKIEYVIGLVKAAARMDSPEAISFLERKIIPRLPNWQKLQTMLVMTPSPKRKRMVDGTPSRWWKEGYFDKQRLVIVDSDFDRITLSVG